MKQIVFYADISYYQVGQSAYVRVISHPQAGISDFNNGDWVHTSRVLKTLESGDRPMFETLNSLYSPIERWKEEAEFNEAALVPCDD
jgi:hypothetical protein